MFYHPFVIGHKTCAAWRFSSLMNWLEILNPTSCSIDRYNILCIFSANDDELFAVCVTYWYPTSIPNNNNHLQRAPPWIDGIFEDTRQANRTSDFIQFVLLTKKYIPWGIFWCILKDVPLQVFRLCDFIWWNLRIYTKFDFLVLMFIFSPVSHSR